MERLSYSSFSGKVAGKSLKMTGLSDIWLPSYGSGGLVDEIPASDGFLDDINSTQFERPRFCGGVSVCGNHQHGYVWPFAFHFPQQIDSRFPRHPVVADDEI